MTRLEELERLVKDKEMELEALKRMRDSWSETEEKTEEETMMTEEGYNTAIHSKEEIDAMREKDYEEHTVISRDTLKETLTQMARAGYGSEIRAILKEHGASNLSSLPDEHIAPVYFAAMKLGGDNAR